MGVHQRYLHRLVLCLFSSRRRHTRFDCDWSSDVCSSDLAASRSLASAVTVVKRTRKPAWMQLTPKAQAIWVFPVPGGPMQTTDSLCFKKSALARASTLVLGTEGCAVKSKVSKVFASGKWASARSIRRRFSLREINSDSSSAARKTPGACPLVCASRIRGRQDRVAPGILSSLKAASMRISLVFIRPPPQEAGRSGSGREGPRGQSGHGESAGGIAAGAGARRPAPRHPPRTRRSFPLPQRPAPPPHGGTPGGVLRPPRTPWAGEEPDPGNASGRTGTARSDSGTHGR